MKKIYSIIFLFCSLSIASFASPALCCTRQLPGGLKPGTAGTDKVVILSNISDNILRGCGYNNNHSVEAISNTFSYASSNSWIKMNNQHSLSDNSGALSVPGAGFVIYLYGADIVALNAGNTNTQIRFGFFAFERHYPVSLCSNNDFYFYKHIC